MNIAILTTKTIHHAFFVHQIRKKFNSTDTYLEKIKKFSKFKISHPIDKIIYNYEKKNVLKIQQIFYTNSINTKSLKHLTQIIS